MSIKKEEIHDENSDAVAVDYCDLLDFPSVEQVKNQIKGTSHIYAYYMMTGYSDYRPIMIKCNTGVKLVSEGTQEMVLISIFDNQMLSYLEAHELTGQLKTFKLKPILI